MDTRKVSALTGFLLLFGCIFGVVYFVYHGGSGRSSYKSMVDESWRKREMKMQGKKESGILNSGQQSIAEAKLLAEELQRLFVKIGKGDEASFAVEEAKLHKDHQHEKANEENAKEMSLFLGKPTSAEMIPPMAVPSENMAFVGEIPNSSPQKSNKNSVNKEASQPQGVHALLVQQEAMRANTEKVETHHLRRISSNGPKLQTSPPNSISNPVSSSNNSRSENERLLVRPYPQGSHSHQPSSMSMSTRLFPVSTNNSDFFDRSKKGMNREPYIKQVRTEDFDFANSKYDTSPMELNEKDFYDTSNSNKFLDDDGSDEFLKNVQGATGKDPLKQMGNLVELVTNMYNNGINSTNFNGILRVINETMGRGNTNPLLAHLNELHAVVPETGSSSLVNATNGVNIGRKAYETSLTAFFFMSFGIFLLNQIHNVVHKESAGSVTIGEGRSFKTNELDESELDILFKPPPNELKHGKTYTETPLTGIKPKNTSSKATGDGSTDRESSDLNLNPTSIINNSPLLSHPTMSVNEKNSSGSDYVNNMFRAVLNLVNAYTSKNEALECIWSIYCTDLNKTAAKPGSLYSLAARINSIGLRLIVGQIPTDLTGNVMLRSLLGWDGLPCVKMFPQCKFDEGIVRLQTKLAISGNHTSF